MSVDFIVNLVDKISAPAKAASGAMKNIGVAAKTAAGGLDQIGDAAGLVGGQIGSTIGKLESFGSQLAELGPAGLAIAAVLASVALAAGAIALAYKGMTASLEAAEAKQQLLTTIGQANFDTLVALSSQLPQTREQLGKWATTLNAAGVTAAQMPDRLKAIASAQALMGSEGEGAAKKVENLFAKISESAQLGTKLKINEKMFQGIGVSVDDVAAKLGVTGAKLKAMMKSGAVDSAKFGDALQKALIDKGKTSLERLGNSIGTIKAKFSESILHMFEDANAEPFLAGLKSVAKLFDSSTASGKAMKLLVTKAFDAIFAVAARVFPYIRAVIIGVAIAALKIYIALKPAINALAELFGGEAGDGSTIIDALSAIGGAIAWFITENVKAVQAVQAAWTWLSNEFDIVHDDAVSTVAGIISAITTLPGKAVEVATNFIQGLVNGIQNGTGLVIDAVRALGQGAMTALKSILGIASPSKEMAKLGKFTAQGFTQGVDAHAQPANDALANMVAPDSMPASKPSSGGGKVIQITFADGAIRVDGAGMQAREITMEMVSTVFEEIALSQGVA